MDDRRFSWLAWVCALGLSGGGLPACSGECITRSDCDPGQFCDFATGACLNGCGGPDDCAPTATCDLQTGICQPAPVSPPLIDAGTSTTTDAGI